MFDTRVGAKDDNTQAARKANVYCSDAEVLLNYEEALNEQWRHHRLKFILCSGIIA